MHRKSRILLCRLGVVILCVLPTTVVAGWIVARGVERPAARQAEWQRELSQRLGLIVELDDVSYPSPNVARLRGLKLLAAESHQAIGAAVKVEIGKSQDGWTVSIDGLSLEASQLRGLARTLDERILRELQLPAVHWQAHDVVVRHDDRGQTFSEASGQLRADPTGAQWDCRFRLAGHEAGELASLQAQRSRERAAPTTAWQLDTAGQSLPCWLASNPAERWLGPDCEFAGTVHFVREAGGSRGELTGKLTHVDLDALVTERFPHVLSGMAQVDVDNAMFDEGRLKKLRGRVAARGGAISRSLLAAAREHLRLEAGDGPSELSAAAAIPFDRLALAFELSGPWLSLAPLADSDPPGVVLSNAAGALLVVPTEHAVTSAGLLRTLLPDSQHYVPATEQTSALVRLLPLPDVALPAAGRPQHTPTRLAPAGHAEEGAVRQPVLR